MVYSGVYAPILHAMAHYGRKVYYVVINRLINCVGLTQFGLGGWGSVEIGYLDLYTRFSAKSSSRAFGPSLGETGRGGCLCYCPPKNDDPLRASILLLFLLKKLHSASFSPSEKTASFCLYSSEIDGDHLLWAKSDSLLMLSAEESIYDNET